MRPNIVMICGGYYPNYSATCNCIHQIANKFVEQGANVTVISKSYDGIESTVFFEGQRIYRVTYTRIKDFVRIHKEDGTTLKGKAHIFVIKAYWATRLLLIKSGMDESLVRSYLEKLEEIEFNRIDAVLPCCMPAEAIKAGYLFCKKHSINLFPILYDNYSDNKDYFRFSWNHKLKKGFAVKFECNPFAFN